MQVLEKITKESLFNHLKDKSTWTETIPNNDDYWVYSEINEKYTVGRQRIDWAIFKRGKNLKFYYAKGFKHIPEDLLNDLEILVNEEKS